MAYGNAVPFFFDSEINEDQAARDFVWSPVFTASISVVNITATLADVGLGTFQMVYIDNSGSPAPTSILISGTRQVITAAPFTQGYYRVLGSPSQLDITATNYAGAVFGANGLTIPIHFLNIVPDGAAVWNTGNNYTQAGTPLSGSTTGANSSINVTFANVTGRRIYIDGFIITGAGATAASVVAATLAGVDNMGSPQTLTFDLAIPAGATLGIQPLVQNFSPPLPICLGNNAVLTLPALGAGNTNAAVSMTGFMV